MRTPKTTKANKIISRTNPLKASSAFASINKIVNATQNINVSITRGGHPQASK